MRLTLYQTVNSAVHGLDPRGKLLALFTWSGALLLFDDPLFLIWPFLGLMVMAAVSRVLRAYRMTDRETWTEEVKSEEAARSLKPGA